MKWKAITIVFLVISALTQAQRSQNSLGMRFGLLGGYGTEISYQAAIGRNGAELDYGWGTNNDYNFWGVTGMFQFIRPIKSGFYWFAGTGPSVGERSARSQNNNGQSGAFLSLSVDAGAEYNFVEIPIQVSLDGRYDVGLINKFNLPGLALAVRYRF